MTDTQKLAEALAALSPEDRATLEAKIEKDAEEAFARNREDVYLGALRDLRQDGPLTDPRDLGPVGG